MSLGFMQTLSIFFNPFLFGVEWSIKNNSSSRTNQIGEFLKHKKRFSSSAVNFGPKVWQLVDMIGVSSLLFLWKAKSLQYV